MRVAFTDRQSADVMDVLHRHGLYDHAAYFEAVLVRRTAIRFFDAYAPPTFWRGLRDLLADDLYIGLRHASLPGVSARLRRALKSVAQAVALREHHPAIRRRAALGRQHELLPVWWDGGSWSPYPASELFKILVPEWRFDQKTQMEITRWLPQDPTLWVSPDFPWLDESLNVYFSEWRPLEHLVRSDERRRDVEPE